MLISRHYIDNYSNLGSGYTVYYGITNDGRQKELAYYAWKICEAAYDVYPDDASGEVVKKFDSTGETITYYYAFRINGKGTSYSSCINRIKKLEKDAKLYELDMKQNTLKMRKKYIC